MEIQLPIILHNQMYSSRGLERSSRTASSDTVYLEQLRRILSYNSRPPGGLSPSPLPPSVRAEAAPHVPARWRRGPAQGWALRGAAAAPGGRCGPGWRRP